MDKTTEENNTVEGADKNSNGVDVPVQVADIAKSLTRNDNSFFKLKEISTQGEQGTDVALESCKSYSEFSCDGCSCYSEYSCDSDPDPDDRQKEQGIEKAQTFKLS